MTSVVTKKFFKELIDPRTVHRWKYGIRAKLPGHYKQRMIKIQDAQVYGKSTPVHYRAEPGVWKLGSQKDTIQPVQNRPIPVIFPAESQQGLWGGEGIVRGFSKKAKRRSSRIPKIWLPRLEEAVLYSEILDTYYTIVITKRTRLLIDDAAGFDFYILQTPEEDLNSALALKMKKAMLTTLMNRSMYPNEPDKNEKIYNRYKHLMTYTREELEWLDLTEEEAIAKQEQIELERNKPIPLKYALIEKHMNSLIPNSTEGESLPKISKEALEATENEPSVELAEKKDDIEPKGKEPSLEQTEEKAGFWSRWNPLRKS